MVTFVNLQSGFTLVLTTMLTSVLGHQRTQLDHQSATDCSYAFTAWKIGRDVGKKARRRLRERAGGAPFDRASGEVKEKAEETA